METLRNKLQKIAGEYASKVGKLLNYKPEFWVGPSVSIDCCCYGDVYFLSLAEMQVIIDHMDEWQKKYGSEEKVGETVIGWLNFVNDDNWDEEHGLWRDSPRINLWSWLKGLRPEQLKWTEDDEPEVGNSGQGAEASVRDISDGQHLQRNNADRIASECYTQAYGGENQGGPEEITQLPGVS